MLPRSSVKKVMIVTGGSRGIGAAVARLAAQNGYAVCLSYLSNRDAADEVVASIAAKGGVALAVQADVAVEQDVVRLFEQVDASLGSKGTIDTFIVGWQRSWPRRVSASMPSVPELFIPIFMPAAAIPIGWSE